MNFRILLPTIIFALFFTKIKAQENLYFEDYNWEENPIENFDTTVNKDKDLVALKEKRVSEFAFTKGGLIEYLLIHKLYWLNSNDAIEQYNKVYLPSVGASKIVKNQARVITSKGKIIELDDSKILESTDNETKTSYKYYAMEGVEKGGFIEYLYVLKKYPSYTGKRVFLQNTYFNKSIDFDVFAPKNLKFAFKTYNDSTQVILDTVVKTKNHWHLKLKDVEGLESEERSGYDIALKQLVFKLDRNYANPDKEIVSFGKASQNIFANNYKVVDKKTRNRILKFLKQIGSKSEKELSILEIENAIKSTVYLTDAVLSPESSQIINILNSKVASKQGILYLYTAIFDILNLEHELVLTANRKSFVFDKKFESYHVLDKYLFFFPEQNKYLEPLNYGSRFGFPNGLLTDNYGLFIKKIKVGDFESAIGQVKYIEPVNYDLSVYNLKIEVGFNEEDLTETNIEVSRIMSGYYALSYQPYLELIEEQEKKTKVLEGIVKMIKEEVEITKVEAINGYSNKFGIEPLVIKATLKTNSFIDNAGTKYLFKIGELIGPQLEMYQKKERKLQVHENFERSYESLIDVKIPEGYKIENLEDLAIEEEYKEGNKVFFSFKSSYTVDNNIIKVKLNEFYNKNIVDVSVFEAYRKVINSAANFNKITLVMIKSAE